MKTQNKQRGSDQLPLTQGWREAEGPWGRSRLVLRRTGPCPVTEGNSKSQSVPRASAPACGSRGRSDFGTGHLGSVAPCWTRVAWSRTSAGPSGSLGHNLTISACSWHQAGPECQGPRPPQSQVGARGCTTKPGTDTPAPACQRTASLCSRLPSLRPIPSSICPALCVPPPACPPQ